MARLRSRPSRAEVEAREAAQPLERIVEVGDAPRGRRRWPSRMCARRSRRAGRPCSEVEVDGAGGDAGGAGDVGDLGVEEAALGEDVDGGAQDRVAFRAGGGRRPDAGSAGDGVQGMTE